MSSSPYSLWQKIVYTTEQALTTGALQPISTQIHTVVDRGVSFHIRVVDSLARKAATKSSPGTAKAKPTNPFLPYEKSLWVTDLSDTHACLLNKFNVVDHHILMVTRHYESQDTWLNLKDFAALAYCLLEIDGLGFYNGGQQAGASQHHKHLQLVPFSQGQSIQELPISRLINGERTYLGDSNYLPALSFAHAVQLLNIDWQSATLSASIQQLMTTYQALAKSIGLRLDSPKPTVPYNLLVTREWMMAVPRSQESYQGIGVNSLGYAGWLLTKTLADLDALKRIGPMNLLQYVGYC